MTLLLEGVSLVVANKVLEAQFPGGLRGFRATLDNGSFCTDGTVSRLSFFEPDDALCTLMAMPDYGLELSPNFAADVAVFLYGGISWPPCLWLESSFETGEMPVCWHVDEEKSDRIAVPGYFRRGATLARYGHLEEDAIMAKVTRAGEKNGVSLFRDAMSKQTFAGPGRLRRH